MLPDWVDVERAVHRLQRALQRRGMVDQANAAVSGPQTPCTLPGFDVFSRGAHEAPYRWCVPRPYRDEADLLNVWEECVDRELGAVRNPGRVARQAAARCQRAPWFGGPRSTSRWRMPLVKLAAMAQHCPHRSLSVQGQTVHIEIEGATLEVSTRHAWSNLHRRSVFAKRPAVDIGYDEVSVPPIRTSHGLASFLSGRVEDEILWLANVAIQGERFRKTPPLHFSDAPEVVRGERQPRLPVPIDVLGASLTCRELLETGESDDLIVELFQTAVPTLMSARYFRNHFANPYKEQSRVIKPETRQRWAAHFESLADDLQQQHAIRARRGT